MTRIGTSSILPALLLVPLLFPSAVAAPGKKKAQPPDWSRPESIDPLREEVTSFLEENPAEHRTAANRAYGDGRYKDAARHYLAFLRHRSDDPEALYNLACCYGLMGEARFAADNLVRAVLAGFRGFDHIRGDEDFRKVRGDAYFRERMKAIDRLEASLGDTIWIEASRLVKCRIKVPDGYDPEKEYPLLVALHGNGGNADDMIRLWQSFAKRDFLFAAPQGAYPKPGAAADADGQYSWELQVRDEALWRRADPLSVAHVRSVVDEIRANYRVGKVFLLGFSQGAAYTYLTGILHHDLFAGIVCIGGRLPDTGSPGAMLTVEDLEAASTLPVLIAHSRTDGAISIDRALEARKRLRKHGYEVTFHEYAGGHRLTLPLMKRVAEWMRAEK